MADNYTRGSETFRSQDYDSVEFPIIAATDSPDVVPSLTGATLVYTVDDSPAVPLDPPTADARLCFVRVWHAAQDSTARMFYRRDGTAPTANGANAEGFLVHGEARMVRLPGNWANFQMISETGEAHTVYAEWSD